MPKNETVEVGHIGVDAGLIWVGDPCYVMGADASSAVKDWSEFCERLNKIGYFEDHEKRFSPVLGDGVGFAIESGYGDGAYPVSITYNGEGRVSKITIDLEPYWEGVGFYDE